MGVREERLGSNEALFREVNERVAEVAEHFLEGEGVGTSIEFTCECARVDCTEQMEMTLAEFEAVRAESTRFAIVPGHEAPDIERVIERHRTYFVVEKVDPEAAEIARETDPQA